MAKTVVADRTPAEVLALRRRRRIVLGALAVLAIVVLSAVAVTARSRLGFDPQDDCGDVGVTGPAAPTPEDALAAWLERPEADGQPEMSAWRSATTGDGLSTFRNTDARRRAYHPEDGYHTVDVRHTAAGWSVAGACV